MWRRSHRLGVVLGSLEGRGRCGAHLRSGGTTATSLEALLALPSGHQ
ncbi:hypothetical protein HMPREF1556_01181 [Porphyromonas sp. oral taxon 278 str. W7784]|nr:hypothetical protein HMPREF1556_01181 [Porphyromonas sp. oral taxon 278 str. W7784]